MNLTWEHQSNREGMKRGEIFTRESRKIRYNTKPIQLWIILEKLRERSRIAVRKTLFLTLFRSEKGLKKSETERGRFIFPYREKIRNSSSGRFQLHFWPSVWNFGAVWKEERGEEGRTITDPHRSNYLASSARSFLLFLLIRFWHQLSSLFELCYLCGYRHVKIHLPLFIQRGPLRCADVH